VAGQPIFLKVYRSGKLITNRQFVSDQVSIGSNADGPSLVLADPSVHSWHVLIEKKGEDYHLSDLGSPTGTFVNTKLVLESKLEHGDKLQVGDFVVQFFIGVPFVKAGTEKSTTAVMPKDSGTLSKAKTVALKKAPVTKTPVEETPPVVPEKTPVAPSTKKPLKTSVEPDTPVTPVKPMKPKATVLPPLEKLDRKENIKTPPSPPSSFVPSDSLELEPPEPGQQTPQEPALPPDSLELESTDPSVQQQRSQAPSSPASAESETSINKDLGGHFYTELENIELPDEENTLAEETILTDEKLLTEEKVTIKPLDKTVIEKTEEEPEGLESKKKVLSPSDASLSPPSHPKSEDTASVASESIRSNLSPLKKEHPPSHGTFAPKSSITELDKHLALGTGPVVEVIVAWKERVLSVHHFKDNNRSVTFGSSTKADIHCPNLIGKSIYKLLDIKNTASVNLSDSIKGHIIDKKGFHSFEKLMQKNIITTKGVKQFLPLAQSQIVRVDFPPSLKLYIRYSNRVTKAVTAGLFDLNFSEMMGVMMSFFFMSMLVFYLTLFSPQSLDSTEDLEEEALKKATIEFKKQKPPVKLYMTENSKKRGTKLSIPQKQKVPKKSKKMGIKKQGSKGRLDQVVAKPKERSKQKTVTSARPGGSVNTKSKGATATPPRPDPSKMGLLGVFGAKGTKKVLDQAYSGSGDLAGLAAEATGKAGNNESYTGEGIGTRFKNTGAGGKGANLIGVSSGIKTKGRGGGARGYGTGGSLGSRGMVQLELGYYDWDVGGGIDKNAILRVIRSNKRQLEWCYDIALQKKPDLEGKVLLQWDIMNERVSKIRVSRNNTRDPVLARCLMNQLRKFRFTGTGLEKGQIGAVSIPFAVTKK